MNVKISLVEFDEGTAFSVEKLKDWFPKGKFDKKFPQEYIFKWLRVNSRYLEFLGVSCKWDENNKKLILTPSNKIGVVPLKNPYGGQVYGSITVKPKLGWVDIYEILDLIDWKYQPFFLKNEEPIFANGVLPRWFKAVETLEAIYQALSLLMKRICSKHIFSKVPIGNVNWNDYGTKSVPYGKYNYFSTTVIDYSFDLEVHHQFKGVVKIVEKDISNPEVPIKIRSKSRVLMSKIERWLVTLNCDEPSVEKLKKISVPSFYKLYYDRAIQKCIEYIGESKFSNEAGKFYGLPWAIEMDKLFEHWVEFWASKFALRIGARFFSDIKNNSRIRFYNLGNWKSMNKLKPDIIIEKEDKTLIIDVKYKKHLEYIQYGMATSEILEEHRHDIHQILSYMSSSVKRKRLGCLIYPKINDTIVNQYSTLINYTNVRAYVDIALCGINFDYKTVLSLLDYLWCEKYASFQ
ncbi:MAG: hypothetical protein CH6_0421 [Candidatus Kapaibacterium sp.]|nr:MAG: hypothetical protein CH6_0421 [Candidatus Kapabacteria bacterium]